MRPAAVDRSGRTGRSRRLVWIVASLALAGVVAIVFVLLRPKEWLKDAAVDYVRAFDDRDPRALYRFAFEHEKTNGGLTEERWLRVWEELIEPRVQGYGPVELSEAEQNGEHQGFAHGFATHRESGRRLSVTCVTNAADGQARTRLLAAMLVTAWAAMLSERGELPESGSYVAEVIVAGLEADQEKLEAIGLTGWVFVDPADPLRTWDDTREGIEKSLTEKAGRGS
ncbi:MAG: hypothetical protein IH851_07860 [Armatimonadetes bacterium]|nr:hypothetical protein [Armatimonadota bacterium]